MDSPKKVVITGVAGYLGSILATRLVDEGYSVTGVDKLLFGDSSLLHLKNKKNFKLYKIDIQNSKDFKRIAKDHFAVIHLAGLVGDGVCSENPQQAININYLATKNIINISKELGISRFIYASTCSVYGFAQKLLTEKDNVNPVSVYGMTKVLSEEYLISVSSSKFITTSFRMSTLYGLSPRMRFDLVINSFTAQATLGDKISLYAGNQWRPFIHVRDAAEGYILALKSKSEEINGQIFNLGDSKQNFQIFEIAQQVKKTIKGSQIKRNEKIHEPRNYKVDTSKIEHILKFKPKYSTIDGILEMHIAIKKNKKFLNYNDQKYTSFMTLK